MSTTAGYSGTPRPKKLGIEPDHVVAVLGAPAEMSAWLDGLPEGAELRTDRRHKPVCAISEVWSGLRVVHRRENRR